MVETQQEEDFYVGQLSRIRQEVGASSNALYHFDTPFTVENQIGLLKEVGFFKIKMVFRRGNTTILLAFR